jgi:flagellar hook-basal body complex protein FliE
LLRELARPPMLPSTACDDQAQNETGREQAEVELGNPKGSLEDEALVAMQKAQIACQATLHVRNRMVQAYTAIVNMGV